MGSFITATMSSTEAASTITAGLEVIFPNQLVTAGMIGPFYPCGEETNAPIWAF
jgi:hypothetical protein